MKEDEPAYILQKHQLKIFIIKNEKRQEMDIKSNKYRLNMKMIGPDDIIEF